VSLFTHIDTFIFKMLSEELLVLFIFIFRAREYPNYAPDPHSALTSSQVHN
jgi:hypothetical protein